MNGTYEKSVIIVAEIFFSAFFYDLGTYTYLPIGPSQEYWSSLL